MLPVPDLVNTAGSDDGRTGAGLLRAAVLEVGGLPLFGAAKHVVSPRFVLFAMVGACGLCVHLAVLSFALAAGISFLFSQAVAVLSAMTFNFILNNVTTYSDRRRSGWRFLSGLASFYAVCSFGALASVVGADRVYGWTRLWWLAGASGAVIGALWNYAASGAVTWRR